MLTEICAELRNWFVVPDGVHIGTYTISGGSIAPLDFLQEGQYFRLVGSVFNDGVHQFPNDALTDEEFVGEVWAMGVPPSLIALADKVEKYVESEAGQPSPFTSESFAGYSYTKATGDDGMAVTWQQAFSRELNRWRKI